jgi:glycosidase
MTADVWLTPLRVQARLLGSFDAERCELERNGEHAAAPVAGRGFDVSLALAEGDNRVVARCWDGARRELTSASVVYTLRSAGHGAGAGAVDPGGSSASERLGRADWLDGAVIYGVLPPLYGEPPLAAATAALPRIAALGVTALWLSPLFATPPGDFGYAVTDYFRVRSDFGSDQDLKSFVERAHGLGLEVLLDFVPNHTSTQHPYFAQAEAFGTRSHYYDFYQRDARGQSQHYFDWQHLPNLNYDSTEVRAWMTSAAEHWLQNFGIDGYRVDAAWGIAQRSPAFYDFWSRTLRQSGRRVALIAEASARDAFYLQHGFDAAYDWTEELGHWAWSDVFASTELVAARLEQALQKTSAASVRADRVLRFLNNNDTGPRFVTRHGLALTRAATVALLTLPGIPCLYSFDEEGGEFEPYAPLAPLHAPANPELRELHHQLIALRHELDALRGSELRFLDSGNPNVSAYQRPGTPTVLVAINWAPRKENIELELPLELSGRKLRSRLGQAVVTQRARSLRLELPASGFEVLASPAQ